ncbi:MAG: hypothetical protein KF784_13045 [Fimbriimonadaceae bacterium]|nr:hypothetical protein [Fimbriimonadaceae bacterium]
MPILVFMGFRTLLDDWTVTYLLPDGPTDPKQIVVPHAWRQDVDVRWEGPAIYERPIRIPANTKAWLIFHGVSYQAKVYVNDTLAGEHEGLWDAFSIDVTRWAGQKAELKVEVIKNGGETFPVKDVASGFLPYVYHTFGGIYQPVELVAGNEDPLSKPTPAPKSRVTVKGHKILIDGKPVYLRGALTWGWYAELGHTNPPEELISKEVQAAKKLGFNLIKFCLWIPPHRYLEILKEEGMFAWLELPLWDPSSDPVRQGMMAAEMHRIVEQYRHHDNIIVWTCGCELSDATPPEYRQSLVQMVKDLTGLPLVKDNSGGAEMYGGDPREFGDFYDYHPYCDTHFYPQVLDSLLPGPRPNQPILLGEFNDIDVHRDLPRIKGEAPYWASADPALNDKGVRWQLNLPGVIPTHPLANTEDTRRHRLLQLRSIEKAKFIRKYVQEAVRSRSEIAGYVVTGWQDTPISTAGYLDDWGEVKEALDPWEWNASDAFFLIPSRRPPWVNGGNRPGWKDDYNHSIGTILWKIGLGSEHGRKGTLEWRIDNASDAEFVESGSEDFNVHPSDSQQIAEICVQMDQPGSYWLRVKSDGLMNAWRFHVYEKPNFETLEGWGKRDPYGLIEHFPDGAGLKNPKLITTDFRLSDLSATTSSMIAFAMGEGTIPMPAWRECAYEFPYVRPWYQSLADGFWETFLPIAPDRALDLATIQNSLPKGATVKVLINRVDVRTYAEHPIAVEISLGERQVILTTLRPFGGLGNQPLGLSHNPSGAHLLSLMCRDL